MARRGDRNAQGLSSGGTLALYTDSLDFAAQALYGPAHNGLAPLPPLGSVQPPFVQGLLGEDRPVFHAPLSVHPWPLVVLAEHAPRSNYDHLIELARSSSPPPDRTACLAGSGTGFHGFKGRSWAALPGNVHLSVLLAPDQPIERLEVAFTVLAAVSVVDALDRIPGMEGRSGIKWVNDVVVDGAKLAGVLAYTQTMGRSVSAAVLGIGVNVRTVPEVDPTPFVPEVTSVARVLEADREDLYREVFHGLLEALDRNSRLLLTEGYRPLLERYRKRSVVLGRQVALCSEDADELPRVVAHGKVRGMGEGLEIYLEGREEPVSRGRMILDAAPHFLLRGTDPLFRPTTVPPHPEGSPLTDAPTPRKTIDPVRSRS